MRASPISQLASLQQSVTTTYHYENQHVHNASTKYVCKRDGNRQIFILDKILTRIRKVLWNLSGSIDAVSVALKTEASLRNGINTNDLDTLLAQNAASLITTHPDYGVLAARIEISKIHKQTRSKFSDVIECLYKNMDPNTQQISPLIDRRIYRIVMKHQHTLNDAIVYERDYDYDYFGIKTLQKSYLLKVNHIIVERPQHLLMRVAVGIHYDDIKSAIETYDLMSRKYFIHATPTLLNASAPEAQLSSCFLMSIAKDTIDDIYDAAKKSAIINKFAGGIGLSIHNIGSVSDETNGLVSTLRIFNESVRYIGGRRKAAICAYLEPWHLNIFEFLNLRKNHGVEAERCRDLFLGLWIPDLFMKRVEHNELWSLMCPTQCSQLHEVFGKEFDELYCKYEQHGKYKKQIKARTLWSVIMYTQMETGQPFMLYKDHINRKSNQNHLGTIKSANLCTEIVEYSNADEIAMCNLASLSLPKFVDPVTKQFDFDKLLDVVAVVTRNCNKIIDVNHYPLVECRNSNLKHRPIGIGVQGLADVFHLLRIAFDSKEASKLNQEIFETIYYSAVTTSNALAKKYGCYESFKGSPASRGLLAFDLWNIKPAKYYWDDVKRAVMKYGLRNSLLTAAMPTASSSQILGNNECFEPYTSNIYLRRTISGEFVVVNKYLLRDLIKMSMWNDDMKNKIIANNGSIQNINGIPMKIKHLYKTVWEIKQKHIINMAVDRGPYIDHSQSMNIHIGDINYGKLTSMHFYGWKKGLKTGMYYLRTRPAANPIQFTISPKLVNESKSHTDDVPVSQVSITSTAHLHVEDDNLNVMCKQCSM